MDDKIVIQKYWSYYNGRYISDLEILNKVGVKNYNFLVMKYPNYFENFNLDNHCLNTLPISPNILNLYVDDDIKIELIRCIINGDKHPLIITDGKLDIKTNKYKNESYVVWIFICFIIVMLFLVAFVCIYVSLYNKEVKFNSIIK
jgi:hypothetical protein